MSEVRAFGEAINAGAPTGPKGKTIETLLLPGQLFPEFVKDVEFTQTHWAVIQVAPRKKRIWERAEPSFQTFGAKYGDMKVTTHDGYVCKTVGVTVDPDTRRAMEILGVLKKPYGLLTRDLSLGPLDHSKAPKSPANSGDETPPLSSEQSKPDP